jgi:hypothetical protein
MTDEFSNQEREIEARERQLRGTVCGAGIGGLCAIPAELLIAAENIPSKITFRDRCSERIVPSVARAAVALTVGGGIGAATGRLLKKNYSERINDEKNLSRDRAK